MPKNVKKIMKTAMINRVIIFLLITLTFFTVKVNAETECDKDGIWLQVLGSGGPEVQDKRASSSYLIWVDGKARIMVDAGGGAGLRFGESGAAFKDLYAILFTHMHVDHTAALPALIKSAFFENRTNDLIIQGPAGNDRMPSTSEFLASMFDSDQGAYRYLGNHLNKEDNGDWKIISSDLDPAPTKTNAWKHGPSFDNKIETRSIPVNHGPIPAIAWCVYVDGVSITFSGDTSNQWSMLEKLAKDTDILVAHNAIPEGTTGFGRKLHMPPSEIGKIADKASVKHLVLSHRMLRTLGKEKETLSFIKESYEGKVTFANDLDCFKP